MSDTSPSNVLLVTVDSLRADAIEPYDSSRVTPTLSSLADDGTVFENAFAHGNWTPMSFPSILASRPVFTDSGRIGVTESTTVAEQLSAASVATGGFNAANGFLTDIWGYDDGFDDFEAFVGNTDGSRTGEFVAAHPTFGAWMQLVSSPFRRAGSYLRGGSDDRPFTDASRMLDVEAKATEFIENAEEPFFLWVHYMDAHTPYVPAPRYLREVSDDRMGKLRMLSAHVRTGLGWKVGDKTLADLRTLYQGGVRQVDASVDRLLDTLSAEGVDDETAVVVAGDHGEEFMEHGHLAHYPKLYDELIHVPLIVNVPGTEGRRVTDPVGLDAIPPTVTDLLDVDPATDWAGESLLGTVEHGDRPEADPVVSVTVRGDDVTDQPIPRSLEDGDLWVSARDGRWVYIENTDGDERELYDRAADPTQQLNLLPDPDTEAASARDRLEPAVREYERQLAEADEAAEPDVEGDVETRLEALGYR
ncbi:sulfatase [Haloparvum sp. PAK95]|uniref:sulfatase n=1 Tax=Haloparvum sp. PAK95 TaxID=3418962 RepID=UPI003D2F1543